MRKWRRPTLSVLSLCLWVALDNSAFAARLLTVTIQLHRQTVLRSKYQDDDFWGEPLGAARVWRYLGNEPLAIERGSPIKADTADPLRATLQGNLVIQIQHVERLIVEAKASELTLIRAASSSDKWFLAAEEVERIAGANGIQPCRHVRSLTVKVRGSGRASPLRCWL